MTDESYTDDDVTAGLKAIGGVWGVDIRMDVQDVLAAVAPAIAARALREAADALETAHGTPTPEVAFCVAELRARAEQVNP